jgi:hypothetical protein
MKRKLKRYHPCPVLMHPTEHPAVPAMRKAGLICMGPYANDRWYIFYPKTKIKRAPLPAPAPVSAPRTLCEKICGFIDKIVRG